MASKRKDIAKKLIYDNGLDLSKVAKKLGMNSRQALLHHFQKDDIDLDLFVEILKLFNKSISDYNEQTFAPQSGSGDIQGNYNKVNDEDSPKTVNEKIALYQEIIEGQKQTIAAQKLLIEKLLGGNLKDGKKKE